MAALSTESAQTPIDSTGWQDMRRQLFGRQHQRDAEQRLIRVLGEVHARLSAAMGGSPGAATAPKRRAKVLGAVLDGANQLIAWHIKALAAEQSAGRSTRPLPDTAQEFLAEAQAASPLFESARIVDGTIDCADVVKSVAALRGADGDALFNDVLAGMAAMLIAAFELIATDPATAPAAAALGETWEALVADVAALAVPAPEPAPEPEPMLVPELAPEPICATEAMFQVQTAFPAADEGAGSPRPDGGRAGLPAGAETAPLHQAQPFGTTGHISMISPPAPLPPLPPGAAQPLTDITPILAARFSRIQLVAC